MTPDNPTAIDPLFKVRNSPLQGVEAYRSDLWRKLQSEGYKGYLQGSIGGATLFGCIGLVAGTLAALVALPFTSVAVFGLVPFAALTGAHYGKEAFGNVGAIAAVSAAQAEISERRRSLLDRYFETPSLEEAKEIETQLKEQTTDRSPDKMFHWRSGLLGALVMASLATIAIIAIVHTGGVAAAGLAATEAAKMGLLGEVLSIFKAAEATTLTSGFLVVGISALAGSVAGLDRGYIRKWFDAQDYLHDEEEIKSRKLQHVKGVERLQEAYHAEGFNQESRASLSLKIQEEKNVEKTENAATYSASRVHEPVELEQNKEPNKQILASENNASSKIAQNVHLAQL